jgi:hypothetical protein
MGTSYETILVAAPFEPVHAAVAAAGFAAIVAPVATDRTVVIPAEGRYGVADTAGPATTLSRALACPVLVSQVSTSDVVFAQVVVDGEKVHEYISDLTMIVDWFIDDGETKFRIGDVEYPAGAPTPSGPAGADANAFAAFAVGDLATDRVAAALRGEVDPGRASRLGAEMQHRAIMAALNLDPRPVSLGYRHAENADLPGAVVIPARPS